MECKIKEHEKLLDELSAHNAVFASNFSRNLESCAANLDRVARAVVGDYVAANSVQKKGAKKVLDYPLVIDIAQDLHAKLINGLSHITKIINFPKAQKYWRDVQSWGCKGKYVFIGCIRGAKEYVERDTKGQIIGAGFFPDFIPKVFPRTEDLMYFAIQQVKDLDFHGYAVSVETKFPEPIGYDGVVALKDLPSGTMITKETRGDGERDVVNIVSGVEKRVTNNLVIILGSHLRNWYGIHTIYPGSPSPCFRDADFWNAHAFIK